MARSLDLEALAFTIANGAALSPAVAIGAKELCGLAMPAAWTTAAITFQGSIDETTFGEVFDAAGNAMTIASASAVGGQIILLDRALFRALNVFKIRSGTSGSPVNQGAARTGYLLIRDRET